MEARPVLDRFPGVGNLLTLSQVAKALGVSKQRVYQMDDVLHPIFTRRGSKMKSRLYKPDIVSALVGERMRAEHAPPAPRFPDALWDTMQKEAALEGVPMLLTQETAMQIAVKPCHFCGDEPAWRNVLTRLDGQRSHSPWNTIPCCRECQRWMGSRDGNTFLARVREIAARPTTRG